MGGKAERVIGVQEVSEGIKREDRDGRDLMSGGRIWNIG
jgi:hypothetical protein